MTYISAIFDIRILDSSDLNALDSYSRHGDLWEVIQLNTQPFELIRQRRIEHVFEMENYLLFSLICRKTSLTWDTSKTINHPLFFEYKINDRILIRSCH